MSSTSLITGPVSGRGASLVTTRAVPCRSLIRLWMTAASTRFIAFFPRLKVASSRPLHARWGNRSGAVAHHVSHRWRLSQGGVRTAPSPGVEPAEADLAPLALDALCPVPIGPAAGADP